MIEENKLSDIEALSEGTTPASHHLSAMHHKYLPQSVSGLRVLIVRKPHNATAQGIFLESLEILISRQVPVFVEAEVFETLNDMQEVEQLSDLDVINLVIVIGGDGTLLWTSRLFRKKFKMPPILAFSVGSLGYLCKYDKTELKTTLNQLFEQINSQGLNVHFGFQQKMRLFCSIFQRDCTPKLRLRKHDSIRYKNQSLEQCQEQQKLEGLHVLNQICIDRGACSSLCLLSCQIDGQDLTTVQADGLLVSTPTGSTAYNLAAGGPLVSTNVDGILFTPICPHSLSFKPVIFPVNSEISIKVPNYARSDAWISLDGHTRHELCRGEKVTIRQSSNPLLLLTKVDEKPLQQWCKRLRSLLHWNQRGAIQGENDD